MWLLLATMLSTLDISKVVDERGQTIEPEVVFDNSVFRCVQLAIEGNA